MSNREYNPPLDPGIQQAVEILSDVVETYESCEGGPEHAYPEPTVRFHGDRSAGFAAVAVLIQNNLPVKAVRRVWVMIDGELTGPTWEIVFWRK